MIIIENSVSFVRGGKKLAFRFTKAIVPYLAPINFLLFPVYIYSEQCEHDDLGKLCRGTFSLVNFYGLSAGYLFDLVDFFSCSKKAALPSFSND